MKKLPKAQLLSIRLVSTLDQAQQMRTIRNECASNMTRDTGYISQKRQIKWYFFTYLPNYILGKMRGYILYHGDIPVGFGLIRLQGELGILTGGIHPEYQGYGLGKKIFRMLTTHALLMGRKPWLEVLQKNRAAISLYKKIGFKVIAKRDNLMEMTYE